VGNVVTALNVTDTALMLIDASSGVEVGTVKPVPLRGRPAKTDGATG